MAVRSNTTLARRNPTWVPAPYPLGDLARFFNGRGAAPVAARPAPRKPVPALEMA